MMWINMVALFYNPRIVLLVYSRYVFAVALSVASINFSTNLCSKIKGM
jgi:hypothetical protein